MKSNGKCQVKNARQSASARKAGALLCVLMPVWLCHVLSRSTHACSTVLLKDGQLLLLGHNLDESVDFAGFVCVNKRDVFKVGSTWHDLRTYTERLPASLCWISRYGSVTWSSQGRDLPDAGINEAGLAIEEMSLGGHHYPFTVIRPRLFQMQWIQYHLDNFSSVEQVIKSAAFVLPDGWSWHFFVADRQGHCAILEYLHNKLVVHTGPNLPVTALCNAPYAEELTELKKYAGFGGRRKIDLKNRKRHPRFVRAAHMLRDYDPQVHGAAVEYVFAILENLSGPVTRRSYVVDIRNGTAYFRTGLDPRIRRFSLHALDFTSDTPPRILDLNVSDTGDVTGRFQDYTFAENRRIAESWVRHVGQMYPDATRKDAGEGGFAPEHIERYARYPEFSLAKGGLQGKENRHGLTPLHWAAYQGDSQAVRPCVSSSIKTWT